MLDPCGAVFDAAGMEIESGADAEHKCGVEEGKIAGHEGLLTRRADADPDEVGLEMADGGDEIVFFAGREVGIGRSIGADNASPGKPVDEIGGEGRRDAGVATVKEMRIAGELGVAEDFEHEIGAGDAFHVAAALDAADPDGGHAVGNGDGGDGVDGGEARVALRFHDAVHADDRDVAFLPAAQK